MLKINKHVLFISRFMLYFRGKYRFIVQLLLISSKSNPFTFKKCLLDIFVEIIINSNVKYFIFLIQNSRFNTLKKP